MMLITYVADKLHLSEENGGFCIQLFVSAQEGSGQGHLTYSY